MDSGRPSNPRRIGARVIGASARVGIALAGLTLVILDPQLHPYPTAAAVGMGLVLVSALIQLSSGRTRVLQGEEIIAAAGGILLIGLGDEQITVLTLLWLAAVVTGAMVRGRVSKLASVMFAIAMVMPLVRAGELHADYVGLCVAAAALLLSGRAVMDEMSELLERARYEADHDGLTGALARTAFHAALEQAIAETPADQPLALLALDIDGFRRVNKAHGHAAGDALLKSTVNHLRTFGGETAVVGRLGGDEFSVIVTQQESHQFAQQILDSLAIGDEKTHGTLGSIGIAHAPTDGNDASALMRASDIALRVAKRSGPGQICLYAGESLSGDGESDAEAMLTRLISG
ncbi:MAG: GGDEF domain-containing protein, partial [Thermoleophilaceae bacterium]|nr:GGDEF domain-containing protein [Thermoleophilaceae bacterium]